MNLTFEELRSIKHSLPEGSMQRIADKLGIDAEAVRSYFGGTHYERGLASGIHIEPGPDGGIVRIDDPRILEMARDILAEQSQS